MRKKIFALALAGAMAFAAFPAMAEEAGFVENEIFSDEELDFINLSAVWFQAVPMENETMTYSAEDADIHIEADISALENDLGYPVGEWVPYLTVDYKSRIRTETKLPPVPSWRWQRRTARIMETTSSWIRVPIT